MLTAENQLDRPVRWVHVSEIDQIAHLLAGRELIMSTGMPLTRTPAAAASYIAALDQAGATALVVELSSHLPAIPDAALDEARRRGFPVITLAETVRFVEITEEIHRGIVADQFSYVEFTGLVHQRFTELSLEGATPRQIVTTAAELVSSSMVLEDLGRRVLAHAVVGRPAPGLLARWETRSRNAPTREDTGLTGTEGWMTTPVGVRQQRWGRLVAPEPRTDQNRLAMVLERAAQALELGRMVERDRRTLKLDTQSGFIGRAPRRLRSHRG